MTKPVKIIRATSYIAGIMLSIKHAIPVVYRSTVEFNLSGTIAIERTFVDGECCCHVRYILRKGFDPQLVAMFLGHCNFEDFIEQ